MGPDSLTISSQSEITEQNLVCLRITLEFAVLKTFFEIRIFLGVHHRKFKLRTQFKDLTYGTLTGFQVENLQGLLSLMYSILITTFANQSVPIITYLNRNAFATSLKKKKYQLLNPILFPLKNTSHSAFSN